MTSKDTNGIKRDMGEEEFEDPVRRRRYYPVRPDPDEMTDLEKN